MSLSQSSTSASGDAFGCDRRNFLRMAAAALAAGAWAGCSKKSASGRSIDNMIVLGVDGMDPNLLQKYIAAGRMPNCKKLIAKGGFWPLQTTNPPQSPVAWSNFISGTNPGGHGIYDFIGRDPKTMLPNLTVANTTKPERTLDFKKWVIPLSSGTTTCERSGPTFWDDLEEHGIHSTIFRVPANFPPTKGESETLSGMGTPDMLGGYGEFSYFTDDPQVHSKSVSGGRIGRVLIRDGIVKDILGKLPELPGPENSFLKSNDPVPIPFHVSVDSKQGVAKFVVGDSKFILKEGEWSDWIVVRYELFPFLAEATGICRFYLKSARKRFALYVTPINIDPANPALPISTPPDYSKRLVRDIGYFYTQGMIEDTNALSAGVLSEAEYRRHAEYVIEEQMRFYQHELDRFQGGFLFYYLSTLDRSCHVFWRMLDEKHPLYKAELARAHADFIPKLYAQVDDAIGKALARVDDRTQLMVLSDHGFTSFRWQFNLNSWLMDNQYVTAIDPKNRASIQFPMGIDWPKTKAYGLGINALYLNIAGREHSEDKEQWGPVAAEDADKVADELIAKLKAVRDPNNGDQPVISNVFKRKDIFSGPQIDRAPDLIVAYNNYYRASWETILGGFPKVKDKNYVLDNTEAWSGDHCVDAQFVPGVLLSSHPLATDKPRLEDLAPTILTRFGVPIPDGMTGKSLAQS